MASAGTIGSTRLRGGGGGGGGGRERPWPGGHV